MPYVDPNAGHNPTTSTIVPASWGDDVAADLNYFATNRPVARLRNSVNQSLTNGSWTKLTFNTETFDPQNCHSTVTNTSRLTVPADEGGIYSMGGGVEITANNTATVIAARLIVNNTTEIVRVGPHATGNNTVALRLVCNTIYVLAANDYLEFEVFVNAGSLNSIANSPWSPHFWFKWEGTAP